MSSFMIAGLIGTTARDINIIKGVPKEKPGGPSIYAGLTFARLGIKIRIFTKLSEDHEYLLNDLHKEKNIELFPFYCEKTTEFFNNYPYPNNPDYREQFVGSISEAFTMYYISRYISKLKECDIVYLGPLNIHDIPLDILKYLKNNGIILCLDIQGYLRTIKDNTVVLTDWKEKDEGLGYIDILKTDERETKVLTGIEVRGEREALRASERLAEKLCPSGLQEVIITNGRKGSWIYSKKLNELIQIPAFPPKEEADKTGCGEAYVAGYISEMIDVIKGFTKELSKQNLNDIGMFSAMCGTFNVEAWGAFSGSRPKVNKRLEEEIQKLKS